MVRPQLSKIQGYTQRATNGDLLTFYSRMPEQSSWFNSFKEKLDDAFAIAIETASGSKANYVSTQKEYLSDALFAGERYFFYFSTPDIRESFSIGTSLSFVKTLVSCLFGASYSAHDQLQSTDTSPLTAFLLNHLGRSIAAALEHSQPEYGKITLSHYAMLDASANTINDEVPTVTSAQSIFEWNGDNFGITFSITPDYCSRLKKNHIIANQAIDKLLPSEILHDVLLSCSISTSSREVPWTQLAYLNIGSVISVADMSNLKAMIYIDGKEFRQGALRIENKCISIDI